MKSRIPKIKIGHYVIVYDNTNNHSAYIDFEHTTVDGVFTKISILKMNCVLWETMIRGILSIEEYTYGTGSKYVIRLYKRLDNFRNKMKLRDQYLRGKYDK